MYGIQTWGHCFQPLVWEWCKNVWYSNEAIENAFSTAVWEWCKNVWYSNCFGGNRPEFWFENDVKMYDIQTEEYPQGTYFIVWEWYKIV